MTKIQFLMGNAEEFVPGKFQDYCSRESERLLNILRDEYKTDYLFHPGHDEEELNALVDHALWVRNNYDAVVVLATGGSFSGAKAVVEALKESCSNGPEVYFEGQNLDSWSFHELREKLGGKRFFLTVVSKSGTTVEPLLAFQVLASDMIDIYGEEERFSHMLFITMDKEGCLGRLAREKGVKTFYFERHVSGRYSVFTPAGFWPIAVAGVDIYSLVRGAQNQAKLMAEEKKFTYALLRKELYLQGLETEIYTFFTDKFFHLGEWIKQLFAESEGKNGEGIYPAMLFFSRDLHSYGQFLADGRRNIFQTNIYIEDSGKSLPLPEFPAGMMKHFKGDLALFNHYLRQATTETHMAAGLVNLSISMSRLDAESLGAFMQFILLNVAISSLAFEVNPFNQPGVEAYKVRLNQILLENQGS